MSLKLIKKLMMMESSVDSLNIQLFDISSSESLTRLKHHHESVIGGLQRKFDYDLGQLNQKFDVSVRDIEAKVYTHNMFVVCIQMYMQLILQPLLRYALMSINSQKVSCILYCPFASYSGK